MVRLLVSILIMLLISLFLSVAIAWMCMLHPPMPGANMPPRDAPQMWETWLGDQLDARVTNATGLRFFGYDRMRVEALSTDPETGAAETSHLKVMRAGVPFRCLAAARKWGAVGGGLFGGVAIDGVRTEYGWVDALPARPIWPGLIGNVALYTLIMAICVYGPLWMLRDIRRHHRSRQGRCGHCSYDLSGSDSQLCPECGRRIV